MILSYKLKSVFSLGFLIFALGALVMPLKTKKSKHFINLCHHIENRSKNDHILYYYFFFYCS